MKQCFACGQALDAAAPTCTSCGAPQLVTHPPRTEPVFEQSGFAWFLTALSRYATFSGRARRKEYWYFTLFSTIGALVVGALEGAAGLGDALGSIYSLVLLLPSIAAGARRMHDTGRSGWWQLLPIVNLVFLAQEGQRGSNRYGDDPM